MHALHYAVNRAFGWQNSHLHSFRPYEEDYNMIKSGYPIEPIEQHSPVCVVADALPVCDDVGGIHGYCNMLEVLHGEDLEEKERMKEWARSMGWTGRKISLKNIL